MFNDVTITTQTILNRIVKRNAVASKITMMAILRNVLMASTNASNLLLIIVPTVIGQMMNIVPTVATLQLENATAVQMAEEVHRNVLMVSTNAADPLLTIVPTVIGNMMNIVPTVATLQLENAMMNVIPNLRWNVLLENTHVMTIMFLTFVLLGEHGLKM